MFYFEKVLSEHEEKIFMDFIRKIKIHLDVLLIMPITAIAEKPNLNIIAIDDYLSEIDPEYDNNKCIYKDQEKVSMVKYIELKYGKEIVDIFRKLN